MSWWFDRMAVQQTLKLKSIFSVNTFVETGTYKGVNLKFWAHYFPEVYGSEIDKDYFKITCDRLNKFKNVMLTNQSSPVFLSHFIKLYKERNKTDYVIIYLDAHFYNENTKDKFIILNELEVLAGFDKAIIIIHDFKAEGLGHINYDGQALDFDLLKDRLNKVNPNFKYYTNTKDSCDPHTIASAKQTFGVDMDEDTIDVITYHNTDVLKNRGILYCIPPIEMTGLKEVKSCE